MHFEPDPKTVLLVVASLRGGGSSHVLLLAEGLAKRGWKPILAAPDDSIAGRTKARKTFESWEILPLDEPFHRAQIQCLRHAILRRRPALIHAHGTRAALYARLLKVRYRLSTPLVYTVHGLHLAYRGGVARPFRLAAERLLNYEVDRVITVSPADRVRIRRYHLVANRDLCLIPNAVDPAPFRSSIGREEARRRLHLPDSAFVVGAACRLHFQKDPETFIRAAAVLREEVSDLQVIVAGEGPLHAALEKLVQNEGLEDTVRFLGHYADMPAFYAATDVFALSSRWEGCPLCLLEAAAAGVPIVATAVPGTLDLAGDLGCMLLVPPEDPEALAKAILRYKKDPSLARDLADRAATLLSDHLEPERMIGAVDSLYREL